MARKAITAGIRPKSGGLAPRPWRVAVAAFDGVVNGDLATACELFSRVRADDGQPLCDVRVCASAPTVASEHVGLAVPWRLASLRRAHTVIIPGIDDLDREVPAVTLEAIRAAANTGAQIASLCTGAFVLAQTGLLDGLRATTHWLAASELERRYPQISVDPNVLYVDNGQVLASAGAAAAFDLCLHMIRAKHGARLAGRVAREAVMPLERAGGQGQFIVHETPVPDGTTIGELLQWLQGHLDKRLTLQLVARQARMSERTLSRRFREHTGCTPTTWIARARVHRAQELLETTSVSMERVASSVGFSSAAILRERFRQLVGCSPLSYRKTFRSPTTGEGVRVG